MALKSKFWKTKKSISEFDPNDQPCHFIASSDYWCGLWPRHKACHIWPFGQFLQKWVPPKMALKSKFWKTKKSISEFNSDDQPCQFIASSDYWCGLWPRHKACNIWPKITENGLKNGPKKYYKKTKKIIKKIKKRPERIVGLHILCEFRVFS